MAKNNVLWQAVWADFEQNIGPYAEVVIGKFLADYPKWHGWAMLGNYPPSVMIELWLEAEESTRRKTALRHGKESFALLSGTELGQAADAVAQVMSKFTNLRCEFSNDAGHLIYELKVKQLQHYA